MYEPRSNSRVRSAEKTFAPVVSIGSQISPVDGVEWCLATSPNPGDAVLGNLTSQAAISPFCDVASLRFSFPEAEGDGERATFRLNSEGHSEFSFGGTMNIAGSGTQIVHVVARLRNLVGAFSR